MNSPRYHTIDGLRVLVEPTGRSTHSVWLPGPQPHPETFYGLFSMGRHWNVTRYQANEIGIAYGGLLVGESHTKGDAIALAVRDYQHSKEAAAWRSIKSVA